MKQLNRKKIITLGLVILVLVISPFIAWRIYINGKTKLIVNVAPKDAQLLLNDAKIKPGASYIKPGNYTLNINRSGFDSYSTAIDAEPNQTVTVSKILSANSETGKAYEKQHVEEYNKVADAIDKENYTYNAYFNTDWVQQNYPLINMLPIDMSPLFRIEYGKSEQYPDDKSKKAIYIYATKPSEKQSALMNIYSANYDPSDYEIIFKSLIPSNEAAGESERPLE